MVEKTRFRLVELAEWAIAAGAVMGLLAVGAAVYGDFRTVRPVIRVIAGSASRAIVPAGIRPGAISVPMLVLPDDRTINVGAPASSLNGLGAEALVAPPTFERTNDGQRESRSYHYAGMDFVVVIAGDRIVSLFR